VGDSEFEGVVASLEGRESITFLLEELYEDDEKLATDVENMLYTTERYVLEHELAQKTAAMRATEAAGDEEKTAQYLAECGELHKKLATLGSA